MTLQGFSGVSPWTQMIRHNSSSQFSSSFDLEPENLLRNRWFELGHDALCLAWKVGFHKFYMETGPKRKSGREHTKWSCGQCRWTGGVYEKEWEQKLVKS